MIKTFYNSLSKSTLITCDLHPPPLTFPLLHLPLLPSAHLLIAYLITCLFAHVQLGPKYEGQLDHMAEHIPNPSLEFRYRVVRFRQHGLTPTLCEDQSGKRALETFCHTTIATRPQDTTDHASGPVMSNLAWDTKFLQ